MLFITNRFPKASIRTRLGRTFAFDVNNNAASNSLFFCESGKDGEHTEIGSQPMFERLRDSDYRQVLLIVHGFNVLPDAALAQAERLQKLCDQAKKKEVLVVALIWPTDNDPGVLKDYWDDQRSADLSGFAFARAFGKFMTWRDDDVACLMRINILAHSMGSRVLRESLVRWNKDDLANGVPMIFRNIFLAAADVVNETLEPGEKGLLMSHAARNVTVYHAAEDLALRASKAVNVRNGIASRRLGHTGPERIENTLPNVVSVDCDDFSMEYDPLDGHTYFLEDPKTKKAGKVFEHIFFAMRSGRVPFGETGNRSTVLLA